MTPTPDVNVGTCHRLVRREKSNPDPCLMHVTLKREDLHKGFPVKTTLCDP